MSASLGALVSQVSVPLASVDRRTSLPCMHTLQVTMFLDKNRATMRPDLIELMCGSKSEVHSSMCHMLCATQ